MPNAIEDALEAPPVYVNDALPVAVPHEASHIGLQAVRRPEWVVLAFLVYAVAVGWALPVAAAVHERVLIVNALLFLVYALLIRADWLRPRLALSIIRDWLPLAVVLLAYREMGWYALPHNGHPLESHWVVWDHVVLPGARPAIEALGPVIPAILEISYTLVYALAPFSLAVLYLYRRRELADRFLIVFCLGVLLCYIQFPFWPSEPPRVVFAGQDLPSYFTIFRRFNLWTLGKAGIHTSVFPSAHVAGAFSAFFGMRRAFAERKWVYRLLAVIAVLIATATVYGRYHYLADASAGFLVAALVALGAWAATAPRPAEAPLFSERAGIIRKLHS